MDAKTDYEDIRYEVDEASAIITIDRPKRLNAFRGRTVEELIDAFHRAWTDRNVALPLSSMIPTRWTTRSSGPRTSLRDSGEVISPRTTSTS
jgi:1,4-dihydroxy-2-naphthoyl-CoA synthase